MATEIRLLCDMVEGCTAPIAYIDHKGFIYCEKHGRDRQSHCRCRKLRPAELKRLEAGEALARY